MEGEIRIIPLHCYLFEGGKLVVKSVAVIGVGTLGGYLCKHISELDNITELIIIDDDIVESRNIFTSIYNSSQIGEYKVNALAELLNEDVTVTKINKRYIEGKTSIPKCNLVIDCRDVVCSRLDEIDVRLYISERVLIIDCRKYVNLTCSYDGSYSLKLSKREISKAAFYAAQVIESENMKKMVKNQLVQRLDLDILPSVLSKAINRTLEDKIDMIYEESHLSNRLQCIENIVKPILEANKKNSIDVYVGEKPHQTTMQKMFNKFPEVSKTKYAEIPVNTVKTEIDVMQKLSDLINFQPGLSNFIVTVREDNGQKIIELLEETGAA